MYGVHKSVEVARRSEITSILDCAKRFRFGHLVLLNAARNGSVEAEQEFMADKLIYSLSYTVRV